MNRVTEEWVNDLIVSFDGESVYATKRLVRRVEDIWDFGNGCTANFGSVYIGPAIPRLGETFTFDVEVKPPWWAFWRKPQTVRKDFRVCGEFFA